MNDQREVIVTNIRMPFWSMVWFLVKLAIASIPALIILWAISAAVLFILGIAGMVWLPDGIFHWNWGSGSLGGGSGGTGI